MAGKRQNFIGGVAVLAAAVVVVKIISAVYKIPLGNILDDEGMGHFSIAYNVYNFLLQLSTAGFPLALSKLTSEASTLGRYDQMRRQFHVAALLFFLLGALGSAVMFTCARPLSQLLNDSLALEPIRVLAPAVFFVCLTGCCRGYTQGRGEMTPTAVSQVLEASFKPLVGLLLAWYVLSRLQLPIETGAAAAIFGVTLGSGIATLYLILYIVRHPIRSHGIGGSEKRSVILKKLLKIGVPITVGSSVMSVITLSNQIIVTGRLKELLLSQGNMSIASAERAVTELYGQYTFGLTLFNLPATFAVPVTVSLLPTATALLARHDKHGAQRLISTAFRLVILLAMPAGVGLSVLSGPILHLLYPGVPETAAAATAHLQILGIASIFVCLMILTNSILQAWGRAEIPIYTALAGGAVNASIAYILCGNAEVGVLGASISTLSGYVVIALLNLITVWVVLGESRVSYFRLLLRPSIATALMGAAVYWGYGVLCPLLGSRAATLAAVVLGAAVFGALALMMKIVTRDDLTMLRKNRAKR